MFKALIEDRDCLFFWDEMPTRLSNRTTKLYESVQHMVWDKFRSRKEGLHGAVPRAKWMRQWELSATPIENSPDGLFSCIRMMNPPVLGLAKDFHDAYVSYRNPISRSPEKWMNLDKLDATIEHMTHRASRKDPEIAKMFPEVMEDLLIIDWDSRDRSIYDGLVKKAAKLAKEDDEVNILALIQVLQMLCDAPSMINESAKNRQAWEALIEEDEAWLKANVIKGSDIATMLLAQVGHDLVDDHHTKFDTLREILTEKHPGEKALVYMTWAGYGYAPVEQKLNEWGVSYVAYSGTDQARQRAKDAFRSDPTIQVFLSSDKGSDSIDLPEAAVGVNYNLPWTWTRKRQRQGRNNRVDSSLTTNWWYDLLMADSVEMRKRDIISTKEGYHTQIFDGMAHDDSVSTKLSREELLYILVGPHP
jgi:SNF2 family DNA or RNA helicase